MRSHSPLLLAASFALALVPMGCEVAAEGDGGGGGGCATVAIILAILLGLAFLVMNAKDKRDRMPDLPPPAEAKKQVCLTMFYETPEPPPQFADLTIARRENGEREEDREYLLNKHRGALSSDIFARLSGSEPSEA